MLIFFPQTPRPNIRGCRSGDSNLVCVNRRRCVCVSVTQFRSCCHQVNAVGNHRGGRRTPEGVGMNVGQIILSTEAIRLRRNAVRVHPGAVVPYKHIGGACPAVTVQLL